MKEGYGLECDSHHSMNSELSNQSAAPVWALTVISDVIKIKPQTKLKCSNSVLLCSHSQKRTEDLSGKENVKKSSPGKGRK